LEPLGELFWAKQGIYITEIFLPVIIGSLVSLIFISALFILGLYRRFLLWRQGSADDRFDNWGTRLKTTLAVAFANSRILKEFYPGLMHLLIFWGTVILILGKIVRLFSYPVGLTNPPQSIFLYSSLASEIGAVLMIIGGSMAVYRRYIRKPSRLDIQQDDTLIFGWVALILITGFMVKGYRIAIGGAGSAVDWAMWSPIGYLIYPLFPTFSTTTQNELLLWHRTIIHAVSAVGFLGYISIYRSRLQHILLSPLNIYFRSLKPKGALTPIEFQTSSTYGADKIEEFTWKHLMDLDACTRCGRCQDNCPAFLTGKILSPKKVILDLKNHLQETYPVPLVVKPISSPKDMIREVVTDEVLWDCTTCGACQQACPVFIEHVDKMVEMRRSLVLTGRELPDTVQGTLRNMEIRGHPWRGTEHVRDGWLKGQGIKRLSEAGHAEWLYWVGCSGALVDRNIEVTKALADVLTAGGIDFAVLGLEEGCCGDPARRMGNELQFQLMAQKNIETFKKYGVKKIIVQCPHGFEAFKNEYPHFGGEYEVLHSSEIIKALLNKGKIKLSTIIESTVTYHDPCYLGRYNGIFEPPREVLELTPGLIVTEMKKNRENSFCCGGGGGHAWMEEPVGERINQMRLKQAIESSAEIVATACPFCLQMFDDAIRSLEPSVKAMDIVELVAKAIAE
jgi:Fe-S oxidoreductase/nitrate reductase gamma subunit